MAVFLDPRFKDYIAINKEKFKQNVVVWIESDLATIAESSPGFEATSIEPVIKKERKNRSSTSFCDFHASLVGEHYNSTIKDTSISKELFEYRSEKCTPLNEDPLIYWKVRKLHSLFHIFI